MLHIKYSFSFNELIINSMSAISVTMSTSFVVAR